MSHPSALTFVVDRLAGLLRPPEPLPLSKWLEQHLVLVDGPYAGSLWSAEHAPYLPEIADCLGDDHPANLVTVRKSQQTGASILALGWALYVADREPANFLYAVPGIDALREINSGKLQPLIDAWERKVGRQVIVPQTSRSGSGSTTYEKVFPGGRAWLANANAVMDLSGKTAKKGVKDELSKWKDIPGFGDPEDLYFGRFTAFRRTKSYKILEISTPEVDTGDPLGDKPGHCRIDRSFKASDQRFWNCVCPECQNYFVHDLPSLIVDKLHPHKTVYACRCGHHISEAERVLAIRAGRWIASEEGPDRHPGFHIDAFISLMMSYEAIAEDMLKAEGSEIAAKGFHNLVLGLPYKYRGDAPDHVRLLERREDYPEGSVPPDGLLITAGADVQRSGIWLEIVAWGADRQSWSLMARFLEGDTTDPERGAYSGLAELLETRLPDAFGRPRTIDALAIDAGDGVTSSAVYAWARKHPKAFAIKGMDGWYRPPIGTPTMVDIKLSGRRHKRGGKLWPVGTWPLKAEFYAQLRKVGRAGGAETDPPGYCHFGSFLDENYFKQITSEYLAEEVLRGHSRQVWKKSGENHLLDCRIYALAMAEYLGLTRNSPEQWAQLRGLRGAPDGAFQPDLVSPEPLRIANAATTPNPQTSPPPRQDEPQRPGSSWLGDRDKGWLDRS